MADRHAVTYTTGTADAHAGMFRWVARCTCGATSDDAGTADGTMDSARRWRYAHESDSRPVEGQPIPRPLDEPDNRADSYDAWLRGLTSGGR